MKFIAIILGAIALSLAGCSSVNVGQEYSKFITAIPGAKITDISTKTSSPLWGFDASASGIDTDPVNGVMTIVNGKASFSIPLWGFTKTFSVSGLQFQASPDQIAAGKAIQAAADAKLPAK